MDVQEWSRAAQIAALADLRHIGLKEVLQFGTFLGTVYGAWQWWRFSKWQIAKRLFEYLNTDEKNIVEARQRVLQRLRGGTDTALQAANEMHFNIEKAIKLLDRGEAKEAEKTLSEFALMLSGSAEVGRRHTAVASDQAATVLLFQGLLAKKRADVPAARKALEEALEHNGEDSEVIRALGELDLIAGRHDDALQKFKDALDRASSDSRSRAELSQLKLKILQNRDEPKNEREAWHDCAEAFAELGENLESAHAYARVGEIEVNRLQFHLAARNSFRSAFDRYYQSHNLQGTEEMKRRLQELGEDVGTLPTLDKPPETATSHISWHWIRLAGEVLILGGAAYLFFLTLR